MVLFGDWGVQRGEAPLPRELGVSPNFKSPPKTRGFRGLKSVSKRSQIYHMIKEEK
jgi:hypothetical protein